MPQYTIKDSKKKRRGLWIAGRFALVCVVLGFAFGAAGLIIGGGYMVLNAIVVLFSAVWGGIFIIKDRRFWIHMNKLENVIYELEQESKRLQASQEFPPLAGTHERFFEHIKNLETRN